MTGRHAHRIATFTLSLVMVLIGVGFFVRALTGEGAASTLILLGVLFVAAGLGRGYVEIRRGRRT
jgi:heme A synthase